MTQPSTEGAHHMVSLILESETADRMGSKGAVTVTQAGEGRGAGMGEG